jgi:hypothetical protein
MTIEPGFGGLSHAPAPELQRRSVGSGLIDPNFAAPHEAVPCDVGGRRTGEYPG